jgi:hypothetical protein
MQRLMAAAGLADHLKDAPHFGRLVVRRMRFEVV